MGRVLLLLFILLSVILFWLLFSYHPKNQQQERYIGWIKWIYTGLFFCLIIGGLLYYLSISESESTMHLMPLEKKVGTIK